MIKYILAISFLSLSYLAIGQSEIIKEIRNDETKIRTGYYFYPSTLRMVNLERDPNFDKLVKPIQKLSFISLRRDQFDAAKLRGIADELIQEEQCESYAEMNGPDNTLFVLGNDQIDYTCILARNEEDYYIAEVSGKIDIMQLTKLYEKIQTADSTGTNAFLDVFSLMNTDNENQRKREARRKKWEEEKKMKADSIRADSIKNAVQIQSTEKPE